MELAIINKFDLDVVSGNDILETQQKLEIAEDKLKSNYEYQEYLILKKELDFKKDKLENQKKDIINAMQDLDIESFEIKDFIFKLKRGRKSAETVVQTDLKMLHQYNSAYVNVSYTPNKVNIKKDLLDGIYIEGCYLNDKIGNDTLEITTKKMEMIK